MVALENGRLVVDMPSGEQVGNWLRVLANLAVTALVPIAIYAATQVDALRTEMAELRGEVRGEIAGLRSTMDVRFEAVDRRFEELDRRFEQIDIRFEAVDRRFEQIEARLEQLDNRLEKLEGRFEQLEARLLTAEADPTSLLRSMGVKVDDSIRLRMIDGDVWAFPTTESGEKALVEQGLRRENITRFLSGFKVRSIANN